MIDRKIRFVIPAVLSVLYIILELVIYRYISDFQSLISQIVPMLLVVAAVAIDDNDQQVPALVCSGIPAALTVVTSVSGLFRNLTYGIGFIYSVFITAINLFSSIGPVLLFISLLTPRAKRSSLWLILFAATQAMYLALGMVITPLLFGGYFDLRHLPLVLISALIYVSIFLPGMAKEDASAPAAAAPSAAAAQPKPVDELEAYMQNMYKK